MSLVKVSGSGHWVLLFLGLGVVQHIIMVGSRRSEQCGSPQGSQDLKKAKDHMSA